MPFHFKMQKVLDYRGQLEEEARVQLAHAERLRLQEEERARELKVMLTDQEVRLYRDVGISAGERWLLENFVRGLRSDLTSTLMRLRSLTQIVEEARRALQERAKDRKLLEKLKERQKEYFVHEERLKEQRTNDETATLRYKAPAL